MNDQSKPHRIFIISQGDTYSVVPKALGITSGDTVIFEAVGVKESIQLFFPKKDLLDKQVLELSPEMPRQNLTVSSKEGIKPDVYPYAVYSSEIRQFVRASPSPKLIFYV